MNRTKLIILIIVVVVVSVSAFFGIREVIKNDKKGFGNSDSEEDKDEVVDATRYTFKEVINSLTKS